MENYAEQFPELASCAYGILSICDAGDVFLELFDEIVEADAAYKWDGRNVVFAYDETGVTLALALGKIEPDAHRNTCALLASPFLTNLCSTFSAESFDVIYDCATDEDISYEVDESSGIGYYQMNLDYVPDVAVACTLVYELMKDVEEFVYHADARGARMKTYAEMIAHALDAFGMHEQAVSLRAYARRFHTPEVESVLANVNKRTYPNVPHPYDDFSFPGMLSLIDYHPDADVRDSLRRTFTDAHAVVSILVMQTKNDWKVAEMDVREPFDPSELKKLDVLFSEPTCVAAVEAYKSGVPLDDIIA